MFVIDISPRVVPATGTRGLRGCPSHDSPCGTDRRLSDDLGPGHALHVLPLIPAVRMARGIPKDAGKEKMLAQIARSTMDVSSALNLFGCIVGDALPIDKPALSGQEHEEHDGRIIEELRSSHKDIMGLRDDREDRALPRLAGNTPPGLCRYGNLKHKEQGEYWKWRTNEDTKSTRITKAAGGGH